MGPSSYLMSIEKLNEKVNKLEALLILLMTSNNRDEDDNAKDLIHILAQANSMGERDFYRFIVDKYEKKRDFADKRKDIDHKINNINNHIKYMAREGDILQEAITEIEENQKTISSELHHYLSNQFLGTDLNSIKLNRFIPVRIYLSDDNDNDIDSITDSTTQLLNEFYFEFSDDFPAEKGSWWKKWFAKSKDTLTHPEVKNRLEKIERAIDNKGLHKPQSEINKNQADAISVLTNSIKDIDSVAIQAGSLLLVKTTNKDYQTSLQVKTLTTKELIYIENNQQILHRPERTLELLSNS